MILLLFFAALWTIHCQYPCVLHPMNITCEAFHYPDSSSEINTQSMCPTLSKMSVCDLIVSCNTSQNTGIYCTWFSLYKEACIEMTAGQMMAQCNDFLSMCPLNDNTLVHQCNTSILQLPPYAEMQKNNSNMCKSMPGMDGCYCDSCTELQRYGELCKEMGGGEECRGWEILCKKIPNWSICTNGPGDIIPEMKMFFHWGWYDYILFKGWIPYNQLTYAISFIAVFFIALLHEGYKALKEKLLMKWKSNYERIATEENSVNTISPQLVYRDTKYDWKREIPGAIYKSIDMALHYLIMLIAMTFNAGLFIAIILGYGVGHILFARLNKPKKRSRGSIMEVEESCH